MANITRYSPLSEMVSLRDAMERLFEESFISPRPSALPGRGLNTNLYETNDAFVLQIPMPGVKPEDVDISVQENNISIKCGFKMEVPENATAHWTGFESGQYQQSFTLPASINADAVQARYVNGVLILNLPKAAHARAHTVKVTAQ
jgi:HSP20 family protein